MSHPWLKTPPSTFATSQLHASLLHRFHRRLKTYLFSCKFSATSAPLRLIGFFLTLLLPSLLLAQSPSLLEQISRETQSLYATTNRSIVHVQLPTPIWLRHLTQLNNPLLKWNAHLDPLVRQHLLHSLPDTPSTQPDTPTITQMAILLDNQGHLLLPLYIEKEIAQNRPFPALSSDGRSTTAHFLGSDRQTNLTLLKLDAPLGSPLPFSPNPPPDGSLVLLFSPTSSDTRLALWPAPKLDYGLIITTTGTLAGIARDGSFLSAPACQTIAQQLIQFGSVKRATLGVVITAVSPNDPLRQQLPLLGTRPALRILQVLPNSPAAQAGLKPNDLILSLANTPVGDTPSFAAAISSRQGPTPLQILRNTQELSLTVTLHPE